MVAGMCILLHALSNKKFLIYISMTRHISSETFNPSTCVHLPLTQHEHWLFIKVHLYEIQEEEQICSWLNMQHNHCKVKYAYFRTRIWLESEPVMNFQNELPDTGAERDFFYISFGAWDFIRSLFRNVDVENFGALVRREILLFLGQM